MSLLFGIGAVYVLTVWEAFAIKVLWGWFLVPTLGAPAIGMAQAYGLSLLIGLVVHQAPSNLGEDGRTAQVLQWAIVAPAMALLVGWIVKQMV